MPREYKVNLYLNHYRCPCGAEWSDEWDATCDDRCPRCDTSCSPYESEDTGTERRPVPTKALEICAKWVARFGLGFHPDTRGAQYTPALLADDIADYDRDMESLFALDCDPYAVAVAVMEDFGLIEEENEQTNA